MQLSQIITRDVETIGPQTSVKEAAAQGAVSNHHAALHRSGRSFPQIPLGTRQT